ncbi:putative DRAP deaminase [Rosellinia necatrix]|uniref:Putative DRAP deaminase n=1 Tax=Rosellinia necatrix TaxID=77044 RepID=A0A1W2TCS8_ROSNE|nr:putative DRAP deaminase [Rosellinia necatrix]
MNPETQQQQQQQQQEEEQPWPAIRADDHRAWMEYALAQARKSRPAPTKYCVGAVLVDAGAGAALATGYSSELPGDRTAGDPGSVHAERCCLIKVAARHGVPEDGVGGVLPKPTPGTRGGTVLYTTMEPCGRRLSGNRTCVDRILALGGAIGAVYVGIREPDTFIPDNDGVERLRAAGVEVVFVDGMRERILEVSTAGHEPRR